MDVLLLGPIEARLAGHAIPLGARKQRAVLAMLALRAERTVSTDRLAEGLWGEDLPPSAPKMVQLYVSQLRRLFDGNGAEILTRGRGYELRLGEGSVDTKRFEELVERGEPAAAREALALWRGAPLADVADEPFAAGEIRRLEDLRLRAVELAVEAELAAGRHAAVLGELDALIAEHPLSERLHAQRMLALYRSGRQAEALEAYREARLLLVEQAGLEPGPDLRRLQEAMLRHDPSLDAPVPAEQPAPPPSGPPPARPVTAQEPPPPDRRPPRNLLVAAAAVLLIAGALVFALTRSSSDDEGGRLAEDSVGVIDPDSGAVGESLPVGHSPAGIAAGAGSLWVTGALDGTVSRVDRGDRRVATIDVGGEPAGVAVTAGSVWVADSRGGTLVQIDARTNRVVGRTPVGHGARGVAAGFGAIWVTAPADARVARLDLRSGRLKKIAVPGSPGAVATGAGGVWVAGESSGQVVRLDPATGAVVDGIQVGNGPDALAAGATGVWVANRPDGTVSRIDPSAGAVRETVPVGRAPSAILLAGRETWVALADDGSVVRLDERGGRIGDKLRVGSSPTGLALDHGALVAAAQAAPARHRGGTLRVEVTSNEFDSDPLGPEGYSGDTFQLTSLAYDGLVAYHRLGGAAGTILDGALATRVPQPTAGGRSYRFVLRPGLRYSDGSPVRASDVRASFERMLQVTAGAIPAFYAGIVGANRCTSRRVHCDLSRGIVADDHARTVTFHLTAPDAEFLHNLTIPFAYVVPAATPRRALASPPPGTGPYVIARWNASRGGVLVRNRYFHSWSTVARPPGYADRIAYRVRPDSQRARQVADVRAGRSDLLDVSVNPGGGEGTGARLRALRAGAAGQLHFAPTASTYYLYLDVRLPPFDDVRVRRAFNFAIDRGAVSRATGGEEVAHPTCQMLPPLLPGYTPDCPYTEHPSEAGAWTAPDWVAARRLMAASHRRGERVMVWTPAQFAPVARLAARTLRRLGFRASARPIPIERYFRSLYSGRLRPQAGISGWVSDTASPSNFFTTNFGCDARGHPVAENLSRFCDPRVQSLIERATRTDGSAAVPLWRRVDHMVTRAAPAVALVNPGSIQLGSARIGNLQTHVQLGTLLDRAWVR